MRAFLTRCKRLTGLISVILLHFNGNLTFAFLTWCYDLYTSHTKEAKCLEILP